MGDETNVLKLVKSNRRDVDRLFDVREKIRELQVEESALKEQLLANADGASILEGDDYIAQIDVRARRSLGTIDEAERVLPPHLFNALVQKKNVTYVRVVPRKQVTT